MAASNPEDHPRPAVAIGSLSRAWRWLLYGAVNQPVAEAGFARQRSIAPTLARLHLWAALLFCFLLPGPITVLEYAGVPLLAVWLLRLGATYLTLWHLLWQPHIVLVMLFVAWEFASLLWSPDVALGLKQIEKARWIWIAFALWPLIERRTALIYALCAGFLGANLGQVLHSLGKAWDIPALVWARMEDRNSAWWAPVVGGTMLTAALGLHIPAAALGRGLRRVVGALGAGVTLAGVIATGSRGAWLASLGLVLIGALAAAWSARRRRFALAVVALLMAMVVCLPLVSGPVARRVGLARSEIAGAIERKEFMTDTGARMLMAWWAIEAFAEQPVRGVGAGGYPGWVRGHLVKQGIDPAQRSIHVHAHNTFLHIAATTGLVGLAISVLFTAVMLRSAVRIARTEPGNPYALGPFFAMVGLLLVTPFDTVHVNAQTAAMVGVLLALCPVWTPAPETDHPPGADDGPSSTLAA